MNQQINRTTQNTAYKLDLDLILRRVDKNEAEEYDTQEGLFIEVYESQHEQEWNVRYKVCDDGSYQYAGCIHGEDYPAYIPNEKAFRLFLKDFAKVYK